MRQLVLAQHHYHFRSILSLWNDRAAVQCTWKIWIKTHINTGTKRSAHYSWQILRGAGSKLFTMMEDVEKYKHWFTAHDAILPLSAQSALSCTIMRFLSLLSANNYLIHPTNVQAVWIHTLCTVETRKQITWTSFYAVVHSTSAHPCSVTCSKHSQISYGNLLHPLTKYLFQSNLSWKFTCTSSS